MRESVLSFIPQLDLVRLIKIFSIPKEIGIQNFLVDLARLGRKITET